MTASPASTPAVSPASMAAHPLSALVETVHFLHAQGWTPATSSNFSQRDAAQPDHFAISLSGLDKGLLTVRDFVTVGPDGQPVSPADSHLRPSAETLLHRLAYRRFPAAHAVLHCHSVNATVLSKLYEASGGLWLKDFEILKGFSGLTTHETPVWLPVYPNAQEMPALAERIEATLGERPPVYGFLLAGHGLYAWGETPAEARRHVETFEFLFEAILKLRAHGHPDYS